MSEELLGDGGVKYTWRRTDVPRRGWYCRYVEDHGDDYQTCDMCGNPGVRYVHHLRHPDFPTLTIAVGVVCSGHLEVGSAQRTTPMEREAELRSRTKRRPNWTTRAWTQSLKGSYYLRANNEVFVVWSRGTGWAGGWKSKYATDEGFSSIKTTHKTWREAAIALFDLRWPPRIEQPLPIQAKRPVPMSSTFQGKGLPDPDCQAPPPRCPILDGILQDIANGTVTF